MFRKKDNAAAALAVTKNSYVPVDSDFVLKDNAGEVEIDTNFAAQSFWKEVVIRFFRKKSGVFGTFMILFITLMAIVGPNMNSYSYSGQNLEQKKAFCKLQNKADVMQNHLLRHFLCTRFLLEVSKKA